MRLSFAMPEMLVLYSLLIYSDSFSLAIITLILGIISRVFCFAQDKDEQDQKNIIEISKKEIL